MNRKILLGILVIGLISALAGAGIYAYFSDTETSTGNVFQAGTLDIAVNEENPWTSTAFSFVDVKPSEELVPFEVRITNVGDNPGHVSWSISYIESDNEVYDLDATKEFSAAADTNMEMTAEDFAKLVYVKDVKFDRDCDGDYEPLGDDGTSDYGSYGGVEITEDTWWTFTDEERVAILHSGAWPGAPGGIDDEWVLPDWTRWADTVNGNDDGYLSIYEIAHAPSWDIDDTKDTPALDPGDVYKHKVWLHLGDSLGTGDKILLGVLDNKPQADGIEITITIEFEQVVP